MMMMRAGDEPMEKKDNIARLLAEAAEISRRAATLASQGRVTEALALEREADYLRKGARVIAGQSGENEPSLIETPVRFPHRRERRNQPGETARALTIAGLEEIGVPLSPRSVSEYALARFGAEINHRALPSLRHHEWRTWSSQRSTKTVYIVPAIEGYRFLPMRGKIALSSWQLERRLIGPWSERADHLRATIQLVRQLRWLSRVDPAAPKRLDDLAARYAATVYGSEADAQELDPERVEQAAQAELGVIGGKDDEWRAEAAKRAQGLLSGEQLLWGAPPTHVVHGSS
jgi:hypothetical protein